MIFSKRKMSDLMTNSIHMLDIASKDPVIKAALLNVNYEEAKVGGIIITWNTADDLVKQYTAAVNLKGETRVLFKKTYKAAHSIYMQHVKFGKAIFKDDEERLARLGLNENRKMRFSEWFMQATDFYAKLLADTDSVTRYSALGTTLENLQDGQRGVFDANTAKEEQKTAIGNVQALRQSRDDALNVLEKAIADFVLVCRYALKDNPQELEKMGIRVYTPGYKRKKKEEPAPEEPQVPEAATTG